MACLSTALLLLLDMSDERLDFAKPSERTYTTRLVHVYQLLSVSELLKLHFSAFVIAFLRITEASMSVFISPVTFLSYESEAISNTLSRVSFTLILIQIYFSVLVYEILLQGFHVH